MHTTTVYLICFQPGIPRGARPGNASHYLGSTSYHDPADRLREHITGAGIPLVKAAHDRGLNPEIFATWSRRSLPPPRVDPRPPPAKPPSVERLVEIPPGTIVTEDTDEDLRWAIFRQAMQRKRQSPS